MFKRFSLVLVFIVGLGSLALARGLVRSQAESEKLVSIPSIEEMDPADFFGTTVLGGLRPLFIDLLWARATDAFARKDWYDALAVSSLICRLQPNLPKVWETNSWNMSYNIAVSKRQANKPEEEWQWVLKGLDFQKKGIQKNPDVPSGYMWLAQMYYDKGLYADYAPKFAAAGINTLDEAIKAAREGAKLERQFSNNYGSHFMFALFLRKKVEQIQAEGMDSKERGHLVSIAEEAINALRIAEERCPKNEKYFAEFADGIHQRIVYLEEIVNSAKVLTPRETK